MEFNRNFTPKYGECETLSPGVRRVLAQNPGPFTFYGTGSYIIGKGEVAVIDPGPHIPSHIDNILNALSPKETVSHILVTHTHADHSSGVSLLQSKTGAPTFGFGPHGGVSEPSESMEAGVDRDFVPDFFLDDGEKLQGANWTIEAVHTPGHCSNHLCFAFENENTLFCGDHLMAWSTTVILPPDGSVGAYLESLHKLKARSESIYFPTHGAAITNPKEYIEQTIAHRQSRIDEIKTALCDSAQTLSTLRQRFYPDIQSSLHVAAECSIMASLTYLIELGTVSADADDTRYFLKAGHN